MAFTALFNKTIQLLYYYDYDDDDYYYKIISLNFDKKGYLDILIFFDIIRTIQMVNPICEILIAKKMN